MDISLLDWLVIAGLLLFITYTAITTKKYTKSVADFLAAGRCAGRYILATAQGEAAMGAISVIYLFEIFIRTGFTRTFWNNVAIPIDIAMALTGFVIYRYRASRALTLAQFFEMRYSRNFRVFAGITAWVAGLLNFGIFPAVGARFFIYFLNIQNHFWHIGPLEVNITLAVIMIILICLALFYTFIGGQIAVLVTDFWQGFFSLIVFMVLVGFLWVKFPWSQIGESLLIASEPGRSLINPFDIAGKKDFGFSYFAIMWFFAVYNRLSWQGTQGYNCSAITPHEAKMSQIIGALRSLIVRVSLMIIPLAAITVWYHPDYVDKVAKIISNLQHTFPGDTTLQSQMMVPAVLRSLLPSGLIGAFVAVMLGFFISTNNTYMHSWGSILIQDVVCVVRKKPFSTKQHMWYLRLSIGFVAVFAFFFGLLFPLSEYIQMFLAITGAIFMGGAGAVIIGGLYWKRGNTIGAWAALIAGALLSITSIVLRILWGHIPFLVERWGDEFPINSWILSFWSAAIAIFCYILFSLLGKRSIVNMDRLLHRGQYAVKEEKEEIKKHAKEDKSISPLWRMIGVNSREFSSVDKGLFVYTFFYAVWNVGCFVVLSILFYFGYMTSMAWLKWWQIMLYTMTVIAFIGGVWVTVGGLYDLRKLYKRLSTEKRNELDDGRVTGDHLLADNNNVASNKD